jgi:hypothetical protein
MIEDSSWGWDEVVASQNLTVYQTPGVDWDIFWEPNVVSLAKALEDCLQRARDRETGVSETGAARSRAAQCSASAGFEIQNPGRTTIRISTQQEANHEC